MTIKQAFVTAAAFSAIATSAVAADVQTILGRAAPAGKVSVESILVTGKSVSDVIGRAGNFNINTTTAKFAVTNGARRATGESLINRPGRA